MVVRGDVSEGGLGFEQCDDGNQIDEDGCRNTCVVAVCGDGVTPTDLQQGEPGFGACDDGNEDDTLDGCSTTCVGAVGGDGFVGPGEGCDDGNDDPTDVQQLRACEACGDGLLRADLEAGAEGFEECDDGILDNGDGCSQACQQEACGNARVDQGEGCDDGNDVNTDACTNACQAAAPGDGCGTDLDEGQPRLRGVR